MTEQERLDQERNWVKTRFNCGLDGMFDELMTVIGFDVREFNRLVGDGSKAMVRNLDDGAVTVSLNDRVASISKKDDAIKISIIRGRVVSEEFEIVPTWNEETVYCDLLLDGKAVSAHRASQRIIGNILFQ